jgi:hypothetical protein
MDKVQNLEKRWLCLNLVKIIDKVDDLVHLDKVTAWGIDRVDGFVDIL